MTLQEVIDSDYLRQRAIKAVQDSIKQLEDDPEAQQFFVEDTLHNFEGLRNPPFEILDEAYLVLEKLTRNPGTK